MTDDSRDRLLNLLVLIAVLACLPVLIPVAVEPVRVAGSYLHDLLYVSEQSSCGRGPEVGYSR